jgi:DNA-directed RNA polymerase subunit M/transcription elongation factor TFIIS
LYPKETKEAMLVAFKCTKCGDDQFNLKLASPSSKELKWHYNEHQDLILSVENQSFVADLGFMTRFASCKKCKATRSWAYSYETPSEAIKV